MHVGSVRTALFAFLVARQNNGSFILRLEDTDKAREVEGSREHLIRSLKALNLAYYALLGELPLVNSELEIYRGVGAGQIMETARRVRQLDKDVINVACGEAKENEKIL